MKHLGIKHAALTVTDLNSAIEFYVKVLGFKVYHDQDSDWGMVYSGDTTLSLIPVPEKQKTFENKGSHPAHLGINFENPHSVDEFYSYLEENDIEDIRKPVLHRDGSYGFYFKDNQGNQLEAVYIPVKL